MWSDETSPLAGEIEGLLVTVPQTVTHVLLGRQDPPHCLHPPLRLLLPPSHFISQRRSATCSVPMRSTASLFSALTVTLQYFSIPITGGLWGILLLLFLLAVLPATQVWLHVRERSHHSHSYTFLGRLGQPFLINPWPADCEHLNMDSKYNDINPAKVIFWIRLCQMLPRVNNNQIKACKVCRSYMLRFFPPHICRSLRCLPWFTPVILARVASLMPLLAISSRSFLSSIIERVKESKCCHQTAMQERQKKKAEQAESERSVLFLDRMSVFAGKEPKQRAWPPKPWSF